jgi:hypothetical protein
MGATQPRKLVASALVLFALCFVPPFGRRGSSPRGCAPDARPGCGKCRQPLFADLPPAALAAPICAVVQPLCRPVEIGEVGSGLREQGHQLGPLECDRRAFRIVLVVTGRQARRLDDGVDLPSQRLDPQLRVGASSRKQLRGRGGSSRAGAAIAHGAANAGFVTPHSDRSATVHTLSLSVDSPACEQICARSTRTSCDRPVSDGTSRTGGRHRGDGSNVGGVASQHADHGAP